MEHLRKKFPVLGQYLYANTAASGLLSEDLLEWRQNHELEYLIKGSLFTSKANARLEETRKVVGSTFNCGASNVALLPCFSIGLNLLLEGLDEREKVLLVSDDYPSLNLPFVSRGFAIEYMELVVDLEERIYDAVKNKGITVLAISIVQWLNGFKIDLAFLERLKKDFPDVMILADGTQFLGTQAFDFENSGIDIMGSSAYKWLLSGYGNGLLLVKEGIKARFDLQAKGYGSARNSIEKEQHRTFCKHLEPGHLDALAMGSLGFSLNFLGTVGLDNIAKKLQQLSEHAKEGFTALGLLNDAVVEREEHSTIFNIKGSQRVYDHLKQNEVVSSLRGDGIRISFHFYNTLEEVDAILKILKKVI